MEEICAYCGEEVIGDGRRQNDQVFCCQDCFDAASEDQYDYLDNDFEDAM